MTQTPEDAKRKLRYLGMPGVTNRSGLPSGRNLAKPNRPPRIITKPDGTTEYHPLDMMKQGVNNKPRISNGSFGDVSTWQGSGFTSGGSYDIKAPNGIDRDTKDHETYCHQQNLRRGSRIVVTKGAKGKSRNASKRKASSPAIPKVLHVSYDRKVLAELLGLRADMLTAQHMGKLFGHSVLTPNDLAVLDRINQYIKVNCPQSLVDSLAKRDANRVASIDGEFAKGNLEKQGPRGGMRDISHLWHRIQKALHTLNHQAARAA